jgi:hypothetical protein
MAGRLLGAIALAALYAAVHALVPVVVGETSEPRRILVLFLLGSLVAYALWPRLVPDWERRGWTTFRPTRARVRFAGLSLATAVAVLLVGSWAIERDVFANGSELAQGVAFGLVAYFLWPAIARRARRS